MSSLLTILLVSLLCCVKVDTLGTPCKADLDWVSNYFIYFYITDKLCFYFLVSSQYPYFLLPPMNPLACNWELSLPLLLACHSKYLFCLFQCAPDFSSISLAALLIAWPHMPPPHLPLLSSTFSLLPAPLLRTRKLHKKRRVIEDLVTTLRVEPASVPILSFKLKGLRSRLGSQEIREKKKKLIEVLPMEEQS